MLRWLAALGLGCALGIGVDAIFIEPYRFSVEQVDIRLRRLPHEFDGITIAQLSDFHYDSELAERVIRAAVETESPLYPRT